MFRRRLLFGFALILKQFRRRLSRKLFASSRHSRKQQARARFGFACEVEKLEDIVMLSGIGLVVCPGELDTSFNPLGTLGPKVGVVTTDIAMSRDSATALKVQSDGKILIAGQTDAIGNGAFLLARYNPDGSQDMSFGDGGTVILDLSDDSDFPNDITIDPDGNVIVIGVAASGTPNQSFAIARFDEVGTLDGSFGMNGIVLNNVSAGRDVANAVALQEDGMIVVAGFANDFDVLNGGDFAVLRYTPQGELDTTFNGTGDVIYSFPSGSRGGSARANDLAIQRDGKIVVAGTVGERGFTFTDDNIGLLRLNSDGTIDATFGNQGRAVVGLDVGTASLRPSLDRADAIALQDDGQILVGGSFRQSLSSGGWAPPNFAISRFRTDGVIDLSFGNTPAGVGSTATNFAQINFGADSSDFISDLAIQQNGFIIGIGASIDEMGDADFALARIDTSGHLDTGFGIDGLASADIGSTGDIANVGELQDDERIVVAGRFAGDDIAVARFLTTSEITSDISIVSAQLTNAKTVQYVYETEGDPGSFQVGLYRSADEVFDTSDLQVDINGDGHVNANDLQSVTPASSGQTITTISLNNPLTPESNLPYLFVVVDPIDLIPERNDENNSAATRLEKPGVTVLVHGFNPRGGNGGTFNPIDDYWDERDDNIVSVLRHFGGGQVFVYQPDVGGFNQDTREEFAVWDNPHGQIILVHDWAAASNDVASGQAEAAADALFGAFINGGYVDPVNPNQSAEFHLIGHSRGAAVVSEVVQRMGAFNILVDYVTYLDPHDFAEAEVPLDESFHDPAVQVWSNVLYADNFWQSNDVLVIPSGRSLSHLEGDSYLYNYELSDLEGLGDGGGTRHGQVIDWYFGTIVPLRENSAWYRDGRGADTGFSNWIELGGFNLDGAVAGILTPTDPVTLAGLAPFPDSPMDQDDNAGSTVFFMGDFELSDLSSNMPAGWSYHGGGGDATLRCETDPLGTCLNRYLSLSEFNSSRTHNRFYISPNISHIAVDTQRRDASGDVVQVRLDDRVIGSFSLDDSDEEFVTRVFDIPSDEREKVRSLTFQLIDSSEAVTYDMRIDNVRLLESAQDAAPNDGNNDSIPDSDQTNVVSVPNLVDGRYVTFVAPSSTTLSNVQSVVHPNNAPVGIDFPVGFFAFDLHDESASSGTLEVSYILPPGSIVNTFYKFGPKPDDANTAKDETVPHWYEFAYDGITGAKINDNLITVYYVDGLRGDNDLTVNGVIVDPGAPAFNIPPSITNLALDATLINEGGVVTLSGSVDDSTLSDEHLVTIDWGDGFTDTFNVPDRGRSFTRTHRYLDNADGRAASQFDISVVVSDGINEVAESTSIAVMDVPPTIALGGAPSADEGSLYTLTLGPVTDPGQDIVTQYIVDWGDGAIETFLHAGEVTHVYADGPATQTIVVALTDEDGTHAKSGSQTVEINNIAPEIAQLVTNAILENKVNPREKVSINGSFSDPGSADTHTLTVDWNDGSPLETISGDQLTGTFEGEHVYSTGGIYTITVTLTDKDGGIVVETTQAYVTGVRLTDGGQLQIVGTSGKDVIRILKNRSKINVHARFGGHRPHRFAFSQHTVRSVLVFACEGNDNVHISRDINKPSIILGGPGNDHIKSGQGDDMIDGGLGNDSIWGRGGDDSITDLEGNNKIWAGTGDDYVMVGPGDDWIKGGPGDDLMHAEGGNDTVFSGLGNDIVVAGRGDDWIFGGFGRNLLIGGFGRDVIIGGFSNDILIAGRTTYDDDDLALLAILAEWTNHEHDYETRVANINGTGTGTTFDTGKNGEYFLKGTSNNCDFRPGRFFVFNDPMTSSL